MKNKHKRVSKFLFIILLIIGSISFSILHNISYVLNIISLNIIHPTTTSYMRYDSLFHPFQKIQYKWVNKKNISTYLKQAVVIAEDDKFYKHWGLDLKAIENAAKINWQRKEFAFGGSTISQQVTRNLYLWPTKSPIRKLREAILAVILDTFVSKERILEIYLNIVELGPGIYGAEEASQYYFKGSAKNLGPKQAAFLASILPNPIQYGKSGFRMTHRAMSIYNRIK